MSADIKVIPVLSAAMGRTIEVAVMLPESSGSDPARRYPVIYFLDGHGGNGLRLFDRNDRDCFLSGVQERCDAYGIIMVAVGCVDKWYLDSPIDPDVRWQTFLANELIPTVDRLFQTSARKENRAITGLSMGGHGAFYTALRNPDLFMAVGSTSGALDLTSNELESYLDCVLGPKTVLDRKIYSAGSFLEEAVSGGLEIRFDCGTEDFLLSVNRNLHEQLQKMGIDHVYLEFPGGHTHDYWCRRFPEHVDWFNRLFLR